MDWKVCSEVLPSSKLMDKNNWNYGNMIGRRGNTFIKMQGFLVIYDRKMKSFKERVVVQNAQGKIVENIDFVTNSNFAQGSTYTAVYRRFVEKLFWKCSRSSQKNNGYWALFK